jgi:D-alanyl-D-alanine carboxypeptidase/D-alanyl-D-alanine-endopeptidase (penicillin-binding protein 4)
VLAWPAPARPHAAGVPNPDALAAALRAPGIARSLTGALVLDLDSGAALFGRNPDKPLAPASTEKLTVALAALQELGPNFRTSTLVLGSGSREAPAGAGTFCS